MLRAYGRRRYVVQMRSSLEGGSYKAAHRRHGLASVITIKWRALCGAPTRYSCIVMAIESGWIYATTIITVSQISMANCAFALAFRGDYCAICGSCESVVQRKRTCEYRLVEEARHCQYSSGCGFAVFKLNST